MISGFGGPQIRDMDKAQPNLTEKFKLKTEFFPDCIRHTGHPGKARNKNKKVKEVWRDRGELGRGSSGVVMKQIEKTTGRYRAVKAINKRVWPEADHSREPLVMAILAKHRSLFVEFLGWFEEPKTLYIAMEYLEEGDLTKHIGAPLPQETVQNISRQILEGLKVMHGQGIAHRDIKPANIFVVSMSPVWVKLGDFGVSKRIRAQDATTFHTQVSTPVYGAPEVLGLDSNSETSVYTNSVDIWSLGCVIYELLVGTKLFGSWIKAYSYFLGEWSFPEDRLRGLSPPTDDVGILLLKSMLKIQPEDRPTAAAAQSHVWLADPKNSNEYSTNDQGEATQSRDETTLGRKRKNGLATPGRAKKRKGERNLIMPDHTRCTLGDVVLGANAGSQGGDDPTAAVMTPLDAVSAEGLGGKRACDNLQIYSQSSTPNTKPSLHIGSVANQNSMLNPRPSPGNFPTPNHYPGNSLQSIPGENGTAVNSLQNPHPRRNNNAGWNTDRIPNSGWSASQNSKAVWDPNGNLSAGWNLNRNPNAGWNAGPNPDAAWGPHMGRNGNLRRNGTPIPDRTQTDRSRAPD